MTRGRVQLEGDKYEYARHPLVAESLLIQDIFFRSLILEIKRTMRGKYSNVRASEVQWSGYRCLEVLAYCSAPTVCHLISRTATGTFSNISDRDVVNKSI